MKKINFIFFFLVFVFFSCEKVDPHLVKKIIKDATAKVKICHSAGKEKFKVLEVNKSALASHLAHGDYILDADEDGFTAIGACTGTQDDCDDNDASVHPGAIEICGDGKDNNCNGVIDEGCSPDFSVFNIRNSNTTLNRISAPWDNDIELSENTGGDGFSFKTPQAGQKVGYGTKFFDGFKLNTIESVNWNLLSGNSGIMPYLNIWVTDGNGNYAVIASENRYTGTDFGTRAEWKIFEYGTSTSNFDWLFDSGTGGRDNAQYLILNGLRVTLSQLSDRIVIGDPGTYPAPNVGTGAPRGGYGFNLIWGDTQANFIQKNGQIGGLSVTAKGLIHSAIN